MKPFDQNYKLLNEMYRDEYYPNFLVDKIRNWLQEVIDLLESNWIGWSVPLTICRRNSTKTTVRLKLWHVIASEVPWPIS